MAGKRKIEASEYDEKGKMIQHFKSIAEVHEKHYDGVKYPLWEKHNKIHFLQNGNYITKGILGRDWLLKELQLINDPFRIKERHHTGVVKCYNLSNELIATFANVQIASKLLQIDASIIRYRTLNRCKELHGSINLFFEIMPKQHITCTH